ncbi:hypothetical protein ACFO0N_07170 [Halobium salinum]|uniref:Uncharacterized protein n=1 Tax=Halobium salinum TaxID=1364940 RepID=A0ABD5PAM7_9EURY|nr:hypothetical protein [Halobium salinum]
MTAPRATVTCPDCDLEETFTKLRDARLAVDRHQRETGHDPTWRLGRLDPGVERAGDAATACGRTREDCGGALTPFTERRE